MKGMTMKMTDRIYQLLVIILCGILKLSYPRQCQRILNVEENTTVQLGTDAIILKCLTGTESVKKSGFTTPPTMQKIFHFLPLEADVCLWV